MNPEAANIAPTLPRVANNIIQTKIGISHLLVSFQNLRSIVIYINKILEKYLKFTINRKFK
ncbi:MAG: hypothetical protein ACFFBV_07365 [Promethearchaeota archaeon]